MPDHFYRSAFWFIIGIYLGIFIAKNYDVTIKIKHNIERSNKYNF